MKNHRQRQMGSKKGLRKKIVGNFAELIKHLIKRQWSSGEISARPKLENLHQLVTSAFISLYTPYIRRPPLEVNFF